MLTKDAIVFLACCVIGVFALGLEIGKDNKPLLCPVVPGQQIVSTVAPDVCVYASSYGRAVRKAKAVKS
jgi:hypothetical protein